MCVLKHSQEDELSREGRLLMESECSDMGVLAGMSYIQPTRHPQGFRLPGLRALRFNEIPSLDHVLSNQSPGPRFSDQAIAMTLEQNRCHTSKS